MKRRFSYRRVRVSSLLKIKRCCLYLVVSFIFVSFFGYTFFTLHQAATKKRYNKQFLPDWVYKEFKNQVSHSGISDNVPAVLNSSLIRPEFCDGCFEHNFKYIIQNDNICSTDIDHSSEIDIIILITSHHSRKSQREVIRRTWLSRALKNTGNVRYAFLLGWSEKQYLNDIIFRENKIYKDIIQEDFVDTYRNLTLKTVMAYKWATTRCFNADYFMKTDDDMYVNIPGLLLALQRTKKKLKTGIGGICPGMSFPVRDENSKWFVSYEMYPKKVYPKYCSGTGYVTSMNAARDIYDISRNIPYFPVEDMYVSFCVQRLKYKYVSISGFNGRLVPPSCTYKKDEFVTSHGVSSDLMIEIWNLPC